MIFTNKKKWEYWNHFILRVFYDKIKGFTPRRMKKARVLIWLDNDFWMDILQRHGGNDLTPEGMCQKNRDNYNHMLSNMVSMVNQTLVQSWDLKA